MPRSALTGTRVRERRTLAGVKQADLARTVGISPAYLNLIEHNRRRVGADLVAALAKALSVPTKALAEGAEGAIFDSLREAAAEYMAGRNEAHPVSGAILPETGRLEEFVTRFPGWAQLLAARHERVAVLVRALEELSDRMAHDPHLSASVHEILSAVTSVRSTAAILAETEDIDPEWRARFHMNLADDSDRLTDAAGALVAYLDTIEVGEAGLSSPQEEVEAWLGEMKFCVPDAVLTDLSSDLARPAPELATEAARSLAGRYLEQARADAVLVPASAISAILPETGFDPARIAGLIGAPISSVMRRLATLPEGVGPAQVGLVVCDGSGAFTFRRAIEGFGLPRHGAGCALWPLYEALRQPTVPLRKVLATAGHVPRRFVAYAWAELKSPGGFDGPQIVEALMLIVPAEPGSATEPARVVGPACRVCPKAACPARREPSILAEVA